MIQEMNVQVDVEGSQQKGHVAVGLPTTSCCDKPKQEHLCWEQHFITRVDVSHMSGVKADIMLFTTMTTCSCFG